MWLALAPAVMTTQAHAATATGGTDAGTVNSADGTPIYIASSLPLSGGSAWYGAQGRNGAQLAVDEANAHGGVLGRKVEIDFVDNQCNPSEGVRGITQALSSKPYSAVHDGGCSSVALAIMPVIQRAGVPFVIASPTATSIAQRSGIGGNPFAFKILPTDDILLNSLVGWLATKGQKGVVDKIAFIGEDTDYGRGGASSFNAALQKYHAKLLSQDFYQQGTTDFSTLISRIKLEKPSLLAAYTIGADSQNFNRQWAEAGGGIGLTGRVFLDQIPKEIMASGVLDGLTTIHPYDVHIDTPANQAFVSSYRKAFKSDPNLTSWAAYEAAEVILQAIRDAKSASPKAVQAALKSGHFTTMFGDPMVFDDHNMAHIGAYILGIKEGKVVVLDKTGS